MYQATAPAPAPVRRTGLTRIPLRLAKVVRHEFTGGRSDIDTPDMYDYFADLTRGHGLGHRRDRVEQVRGNTYIEMARTVLDGLVTADEPVDLAILAHAAPSFDPRVSAPVNLTAVLPGGPLAFAVSGQGALAVFTALRVAAGYVRRHDYQRVLVLAMDQGTMPYDVAAPVHAAAAALLLTGDGAVEVGTVPGVDDAPAALARVVDTSRSTVVTGFDVSAGYPCTGLWAPLADGSVTGPVVLADHDPVYRELGVCVVL